MPHVLRPHLERLRPRQGRHLLASYATKLGKRRGKVPLNEHYVSRRFKEHVHRLGLPEQYGSHSLRHTLTSNLLRGNRTRRPMPRSLVGRILGHSSEASTMHYDHTEALHFRDLVDDISFESEVA